MKITVIGGGSWATALVKILSEGNHHRIKWWMRDAESVEHIKKHHHNPKYLSSIEFHPSRVKTYVNIKEALAKTEAVVLAVPAAFITSALTGLTPEHFEEKIVISAVKGMIPATNQLISDYMLTAFQVPLATQCAIAGPCHAEEVAFEKQSFLTIASPDLAVAQKIADALKCRFVNTTAITDLYGVEYAAVLKNIIALASGITHGMGSGDNFQAVLVANAMLEIEQFVNTIAPAERNLMASAYLGDLLVTAYSQFSRNRAFGNMIGRGYSINSAQLEMNMIAEGYYATKSIYEINQYRQVEMPITDFAYHILYQKKSLQKELSILRSKLK